MANDWAQRGYSSSSSSPQVEDGTDGKARTKQIGANSMRRKSRQLRMISPLSSSNIRATDDHGGVGRPLNVDTSSRSLRRILDFDTSRERKSSDAARYRDFRTEFRKEIPDVERLKRKILNNFPSTPL